MGRPIHFWRSAIICRMAYVTFAEAANKVGGARRLTKDIMVGHEDETAESHPFFDDMAEEASSDGDIALAAAGYVTPLESVTDPQFKSAVMGRTFHKVSETATQREEWIDKAEAAAAAYFANLAAGLVKLVGGEVVEDDLRDDGIFGQFDEEPLFQLGDPYAKIHDVYTDLGRGPSRRWR